MDPNSLEAEEVGTLLGLLRIAWENGLVRSEEDGDRMKALRRKLEASGVKSEPKSEKENPKGS